MSKKDEAIELADVLERTHTHLREVTSLLRQWPEHMDAMSASMGAKAVPLYTTPPAPTAQPLTDEQLRDVLRHCPSDVEQALRVRWLYVKDFARAIEAAHGITGGTKP